MSKLTRIISHLPYLAEVARAHSFTKAAEAMHLTQSALSYQIKQLEEKTGTKLLLRQSGSQIILTSAGENLVNEYNHCAKRLSLALAQLDHQDMRGELRITAPVDFGSLLMPKIMAYIQEKAPNLRVDLHTSDSVIDLNASRWEMGIRVNAQSQVIDPEPLLTANIQLVTSPGYLETRGTPTSLLSLSKHTILVRESSHYRSWSMLFEQHDITMDQLQNRIVLGNSFAIREAAKQGLGIAILPTFIVEEDLENQSLIPLLPDKTQHITGTFYIARIDVPQLASYETLLRSAFKNVYGG